MGCGRISGYTNQFKQPSLGSVTAMTPARVCQIPISAVYDHAFVEREFRQYVYQAVGSHFQRLAEWAVLIRESNIPKSLMTAFELLAAEDGRRLCRIPS